MELVHIVSIVAAKESTYVCVLLAVWKETESPSVQLAVHTHRLSFAATILTIWTSSIEPFAYFS